MTTAAARHAKELAEHKAIYAAHEWLITLMEHNLSPLDRKMLWSWFDYTKALHAHHGDECSQAQFDEACHELGVDHDGNKLKFGDRV